MITSRPLRSLVTLLIMASSICLYSSNANADIFTSSPTVKINGVYLSQPQLIKDFHLTDQHGQPFSLANLKGHWTLLFFGFTNCGSVCPTTLAALNKMYPQLQKDLAAAQIPQIVMVSVDPQRDTVARMNDYINAFNKDFIGIRGSAAETTQLERQLHVLAERVQGADANKDHYSVNHTAEIMVINPNGGIQAYLSYPHEAEQMATDYRRILQANNHS